MSFALNNFCKIIYIYLTPLGEYFRLMQSDKKKWIANQNCEIQIPHSTLKQILSKDLRRFSISQSVKKMRIQLKISIIRKGLTRKEVGMEKRLVHQIRSSIYIKWFVCCLLISKLKIKRL